MKVIICGGGRVGSTIAQYLAQENNDVTIIDQNPDAMSSILSTSDVMTVQGQASHPGVLERAGARNTEMIIAATGNDETNMVICQIAHTIFGIPKKIARIGHPAYLENEWKHLFSRDHLPIDHVISPENEIARTISDRIQQPGLLSTLLMSDREHALIGVSCLKDSPGHLMAPNDFKSDIIGMNAIVAAVVNDEQSFIPDDDYRFLEGDNLYIIAKQKDTRTILEFFGHEFNDKVHNVIIMGGGSVGVNLGKIITHNRFDLSLKVIESSKDRAEEVSQILSGDDIILNGDGLNQNILNEAGIQHCETFVAITNNDETNILGALLAKKMGSKNVIALCSESGYLPMIGALDVDVIVNPRAITISSILRHVRRGQILSDYTLHDGFAELIEIKLDASAQVVHKPIADIKLPEGVKIQAIIGLEGLVVPESDYLLQKGDRIILTVLKGLGKDVERIFAQRADYY